MQSSSFEWIGRVVIEISRSRWVAGKCAFDGRVEDLRGGGG